MKIFVTGATGFIGTNLVKTLQKEGHKITINLRKDKISPFDDKVNSYYLDEYNIEKDITFFKEQCFDGIIHLASLYITAHKADQVFELINSNVRFGTHVLECASQANVKWFLNTGTFWQNYQDADYSPVNLYAATKQAFQSIAQYYIETDQILFSTLKLSDSYGPNDTRPKIFNLWHKISKTGEVLEMSSGRQIIDISYIDDIVSAFVQLTDQLNNREIVNGDIFAVKSKERFTLKELANEFQFATGKRICIKWGERDHRPREVMNPWSKGKIVKGWKPKITLKTGILKILE